MKKHQKGISLIEVLTVVVIISILITISYPSWNYILRIARSNEAKFNLALVSTSMHKYKAHCGSFHPDFTTIGAIPQEENLYYDIRVKHDPADTWNSCFHEPRVCRGNQCQTSFSRVCSGVNPECTLKKVCQVNNFDRDVTDRYISRCGAWAVNENKTINLNKFCLFAASALTGKKNDNNSYSIWMIRDEKILQEIQ